MADILQSKALAKLTNMQQRTGIHIPISRVNALKSLENNMSVHHDMSLSTIRQNIIDNVRTIQKKSRKRYSHLEAINAQPQTGPAMSV